MPKLPRLLYQRLIQPILSAHDSPEAVALGAAIGVGIALTPTVGIQMPLAWLVATLFGANRVVALALVWISNPLTVLPIYYLEYCLGTTLLNYDKISGFHEFGEQWTRMSQFGYVAQVRHLSATIGFPLLAGSFLPAVLLGAASYPLTLWGVRWHRRRLARAVEAKSRPKTSPSVQRHGALVSALLLLGGASACVDGDLHRGEVAPVEDLTGDLEVRYATYQDDTLLIVAPVHAGDGRNQFTLDRLGEQLSMARERYHYLALWIYHFGEAGLDLDLGEDGVRLEAVTSAGPCSAARPSQLGAMGLPPPLLAQLGAGPLPQLKGRSKLNLLLAVPAEMLSVAEWRLVLPETVIYLDSARMPARDWRLFQRAASSPQEFRELLVEPPDTTAGLAGEPADVADAPLAAEPVRSP